MANPFFGGAPTAFQGGQEFGAAQRARKLRENALNALIEEYGPTAADPASAATMQAVEQSGQLHPYAVAEQERNRQAQEALITEHGAIAGSADAQERDQNLKVQSARRAAAVLTMVKQRKGDLGEAFDFVAQALPAFGFPVEKLQEMRQQIIDDPDSVDELVELLKNPALLDQQKAMSGGQPFRDRTTGELVWGIPTASGELKIVDSRYTPATAEQADTRLRQGARRLSDADAERRGLKAQPGFQVWENEDGTIVARPQEGSAAQQDYQKGVQEADAADSKFIKLHAASSDRGKVVATNITRALDRMDDSWLQQHNILSSNARMLMAKVAGTETNEIAQAIESVKTNISLDELQRMRQSSPTGGAMGAISDRDMNILQSALGRLEITRDPKILREDLESVAKVYQQIGEAAQQDAEAAQQRIEARVRTPAQPPGPSRRPVPGEAPPAPTQAPASTKPKTVEEYLRIYGGGR